MGICRRWSACVHGTLGVEGTYHRKGDECPCTRSPAVTEVVVHRGNEQWHRGTGAGTHNRLRSKRRRHVAWEGVDDVGVSREVDSDH